VDGKATRSFYRVPLIPANLHERNDRRVEGKKKSHRSKSTMSTPGSLFPLRRDANHSRLEEKKGSIKACLLTTLITQLTSIPLRRRWCPRLLAPPRRRRRFCAENRTNRSRVRRNSVKTYTRAILIAQLTRALPSDETGITIPRISRIAKILR